MIGLGGQIYDLGKYFNNSETCRMFRFPIPFFFPLSMTVSGQSQGSRDSKSGL